MSSNYVCLLLYVIIFVMESIMCITPASLDKTFQKGVKAYTEERWSRCIEKFEESIHMYKLYMSVNINCRIKCNSERYDSLVKDDIDDLAVYEKYFVKRNCLDKCQEVEFHNINMDSGPDESVLRDMKARRPYEYLHMCYFQMHMFNRAASSAYTFLMANPEDDTMKMNVQYYLEQPEVDPNAVMDLESNEYSVLYYLGRSSFSKNNWEDTIANMEEVLKEYFITENKCRVECEQQFGLEFSPEFVITMSNNMASVLRCRQQCQNDLKVLDYNSGVEFLADVLNYLQYSYYHLDKYNQAAKAVASYLVLMPNDEDMTENEKYYGELVEKAAFDPITDVVHYLKRDTYEKKLLDVFFRGHKDNLNPVTV